MMQRKRVRLRLGLAAYGLLLALLPVARQYRHREYTHEWLDEIDKDIYPVVPNLSHIKYLLDRGVEPNTPDQWGNTLLHRMGCLGNVAGTRLLLDYGANAEARGHKRVTPIMSASGEPVILLLLEHGANVNARDDLGATALFHAEASTVLDNDTTELETLLTHGADINARNNLGQSVLCACVTDNFEPTDYPLCDAVAAQILLSHGANPNLRDKNGNTALMLLVSEGEFHNAEAASSMVFAHALLKHGARLDLRNKQGLTALQIAHKRGAKSLARLLERAAVAAD